MCKLTFIKIEVSDHDAIFLELINVAIPKKTFRFRFENTWLKEPSFVKDATSHWENLPSSHLLSKLISVSSYMEKWGRNFFNKFKAKVKMKKASIDSLRDKSDTQGVKEFLATRDRLNEILLHEELYGKQRAKLFWLKGDENTKFFHASATTRRKVNRINFLMADDGSRVDNEEGMCELIHEYFSNVFAEPGEGASNE